MDTTFWTPGARRSAAPAAAGPATWRGRLGSALDRLLDWQDLARSRRQLSGLDDRLLRDIGLDRATATYESGRRGWTP